MHKEIKKCGLKEKYIQLILSHFLDQDLYLGSFMNVKVVSASGKLHIIIFFLLKDGLMGSNLLYENIPDILSVIFKISYERLDRHLGIVSTIVFFVCFLFSKKNKINKITLCQTCLLRKVWLQTAVRIPDKI